MTPTLKLLYDRCDEIGDCRIWLQGCTGGGLPSISLSSRKRVSVRRVVWELAHGHPVGAKLFVFPTCGNPKCVSEHCLVRGTKPQYMRAASKRGSYSGRAIRLVRAKSAQARSKHTHAEIASIRAARAEGELLRTIAQRHGMSIANVHNIVAGKSWRTTAPGASVFSIGRP